MANPKHSGLSESNRRRLQWVVMVLAIVLTAQAVYNLVDGEGGTWPWISVVCWPIVAIAAGYNIWRFSKGEDPGRR